MKNFARYAASLLLAAAVTTTVLAVDLPGCRTDGSILLPNQWSLRPAGRQIELGNFPVNIAAPMPAPVHAAFVSDHPKSDDDD